MVNTLPTSTPNLTRVATVKTPTTMLNSQVSGTVMELTVLGTGAWGSALASLASRNQHSVHLWSRSLSVSLEKAIANSSVLVSAISMKGVPHVIEQIKAIGLAEDIIIVTATKGLNPETQKTPSQLWQAAFPNNPVVVLSGPNLSKEIEMGLPSTTAVASQNDAAAQTVQELFSSDAFRVYTNSDPIGTELGGTLKNVMAIAAGVCDGLKLGTNAKAGLLTRALPEMMRVGTHLGADPQTFFGLAGLGDLLATCDGGLSRNYQVGAGLAKGKSLDEILEDLEGTAEGVNTAHVLGQLAQEQQISVPISTQVLRLLDGEISPLEAVQALMERDLKPEA